MSRRQEVCRDFQRGSCRFGTRCKFLHENQQQQQQQSNAFGFGVRNQPPQRAALNRGGNYYGPLSGLAPTQRQQQSQSQAQVKEHKCTDPRSCKEQIKEDLQNEHPMFWRLTCYAHWKYLPNDIIGDISFEELRSLTYVAAKNGILLNELVQREGALFRAKNAEFDNLLKGNYRGPASSVSAVSGSGHLSSVFPVSSEGTGMVFGKQVQVNSIPPSSPFGHPAHSSPAGFPSRGTFGGGGFGKEASGFSFGVGSSSSPFGTTQSPRPASSLFGDHSPAPASSPFSIQSSPFGIQTAMPTVSPFGTQQATQFPFPIGGNNLQINQGSGAESGVFGLGAGSSYGSRNPITESNSFSNANLFRSLTESAVFSNSDHASTEQPSTEIMNVETNRNAATSSIQESKVSSPESVKRNSLQADIWLKESWSLGEIPEEEPPIYAR